MAYVSAAYSRNWCYEKGGNDFAAKLGALLTNGADLQACAAAKAAAANSCQLQGSSSSSACSHQRHRSGDATNAPYRTAAQAAPWVGPRPGYAWVDQHGRALAVGPPASVTLLQPTSASSCSSHPDATGPLGSSSSSSSGQHGRACVSGQGNSLTYAGLTSCQRSMAMWQRVSPGMMPDTTRTPAATTAEAYTYEAHLLEPVDFTHHLKRTDFAEYTECALRHMHHLKAAAKK